MNDFDKMLVDVRKSFRLLYSFNQRILDLMKFISGKLNMPYSGGYTKFSNSSPKDGRGSLDNWAWDWFNLYFYEFHFTKENIKFSIILQSDTGKWDTGVKNRDVEKFGNADEAKSKLIFVFSNTDFWDLDFLDNDNDNLRYKYEGEFFIPSGDEAEKMYCKVFNINEFQNQQMANDAINEFIDYLNENGVYDFNITREDV